MSTFGSVLRVPEFRVLWSAYVVSIAGDQLARVALGLLVYSRTGSAALSSLTYALTFLPDLVGGPLLSGLADRYPRRELMVVADLARAALVSVMALPGTPLPAMILLLVVVQLIGSPALAARAAVLPSMLEDDSFVAGQSLFNITYQTGVLAGYVLGGGLVAFAGNHVALAVDAATFLASAILIWAGIRHRPTAGHAAMDTGGAAAAWRSLREGAVLVWSTPRLRTLVALACLSAFYVVPESLSVPYSRQLGGGAVTASLLFAATPAGTAIGMIGLTRFVAPSLRLRLLGPLAVAACAVLVVAALRPPLPVTLLVWVLSGAAASYQTVAAATFVRSVPDEGRGQAFGLASASLRVAQGIAVTVAGAAGQLLEPSAVVAIAGAAGLVAALPVAAAWARSRSEVPSLSS